MKPYFLFACLSLTSIGAYSANAILDIKHLPPEQALSVAQSALDEHGSAKLFGNQLYINATDFRIREVKRLIDQLDQAPKRLKITIDTNAPEQNANARTVKKYSTQPHPQSIMQIHALEGKPAHITSSQSQTVSVSTADAYGYREQSTQRQDLSQGFYVTVHIDGQDAELAIHTHNEQHSQTLPNTVESLSAHTHVRTPLGQWITFTQSGMLSPTSNENHQRRLTSTHQPTQSVRLKVELLE